MEDKDIKKGTTCFDCKQEIADRKVVHHYPTKDGDVFKCDECFEKEPKLKNFQECEVYSRIVGYMRPIKSWNIGKKEEFKDRKVFKI